MRRTGAWIAGLFSAAIAMAFVLACIGDLPVPEGELAADGGRADATSVDAGGMRVTPSDIVVRTGDSLPLVFDFADGRGAPASVHLVSPKSGYTLGPSSVSGRAANALLNVQQAAPATADVVFATDEGARGTIHVNVAGNPGTPDRSFGDGGVLQIPVDGNGGLGTVVVQENGNILAIGVRGSADHRILLVRSTSGGTLDPAFGPDGGVILTRYGAAGPPMPTLPMDLPFKRTAVSSLERPRNRAASWRATSRVDPSIPPSERRG